MAFTYTALQSGNWSAASTWHTTYNITAVSQGSKTFTIAGNHQDEFNIASSHLVVAGSTGNDGTYTIVSAAFGASTVITVSEAIPSATANGTVQSTLAPPDSSAVVVDSYTITIDTDTAAVDKITLQGTAPALTGDGTHTLNSNDFGIWATANCTLTDIISAVSFYPHDNNATLTNSSVGFTAMGSGGLTLDATSSILVLSITSVTAGTVTGGTVYAVNNSNGDFTNAYIYDAIVGDITLDHDGTLVLSNSITNGNILLNSAAATLDLQDGTQITGSAKNVVLYAANIQSSDFTVVDFEPFVTVGSAQLGVSGDTFILSGGGLMSSGSAIDCILVLRSALTFSDGFPSTTSTGSIVLEGGGSLVMDIPLGGPFNISRGGGSGGQYSMGIGI